MIHIPVCQSSKHELVSLKYYLGIDLPVPMLKEISPLIVPWEEYTELPTTMVGMVGKMLDFWGNMSFSSCCSSSSYSLTDDNDDNDDNEDKKKSKYIKHSSPSIGPPLCNWDTYCKTSTTKRSMWKDLDKKTLGVLFDYDKKSKMWTCELKFPPVKPGLYSLDCKIQLSSNAENIIIFSEGGTDSDIAEKIAHCAILTELVMCEHLLTCHLLTCQTIFALANQIFSNSNPIYELIWNHGYAVNYVDASKGQGLVETLARDWSLSAENIQLFMKNRTKEKFNLLTLQNRLVDKCLYGRKVWNIIHKYVYNWIHHSSSSIMNASHISELDLFWTQLAKYPQYSYLPNKWTLDLLVILFTNYVWICTFYHNVVGDQAGYIESMGCVPKDKGKHGQVRMWSTNKMFDLVFAIVVQPAFKITDDWTSFIQDKDLQFIAKTFQQQVAKLELIDPLELGINK